MRTTPVRWQSPLTNVTQQDDILELVELSDYIRRERRERIREIQWEREELEDRRSRRIDYDDVLYERKVVYDARRPIRYK